MKKAEFVYREILYNVFEEKRNFLKQKTISEICKTTLSNVNHAIKPLENLGAIKKKPMGFQVIDAKKILLYWANIRSLKKDILYSTYSNLSVKEIEKSMPPSTIFTAFSAFVLKKETAPADYGEVYVYSDDIDEIKKRFPLKIGKENIFVLKIDEHLKKRSRKNVVPVAQIYVDLWNIGTWYANEYVKELEIDLFGEK